MVLFDDHDKHIRINDLFNGYYKARRPKNTIKPNKNFNQYMFSRGVFYYNDFYSKKKSPHYTFKKWLNNYFAYYLSCIN